eukprot:4627018-Prymnesium_polylepis.1
MEINPASAISRNVKETQKGGTVLMDWVRRSRIELTPPSCTHRIALIARALPPAAKVPPQQMGGRA